MTIKHTAFALLLVMLILSACGSPKPAVVSTPVPATSQPEVTAPPQPVPSAIPPTAMPPAATVPPIISTLPPEPSAPALGSINGWLFHDLCASDQPGAGCVQQPDGTYRANGLLDAGEASIGA